MADYDEVEARERRGWRSAEASWALWEVQRTAAVVGPVIAARMGMSLNDVRAIELLVESTSPVGPVELGNRLGMRSASATELVDRLEAAGHVRRAPHPRDRRRVVVELTEAGHRNALDAIGPLLRRIDGVAERMSPEAQDTVAAYLRAVAAEQRAFCEEADESPPPAR
ncbi:MarR family transcriptional regulator [Actinomycetes bacterium KLBMP 9759]